jgi:hypothetical protein
VKLTAQFHIVLRPRIRGALPPRRIILSVFVYQNRKILMFPVLVLTAANVVCDSMDAVAAATFIWRHVGFRDAFVFSAIESVVIRKHFQPLQSYDFVLLLLFEIQWVPGALFSRVKRPVLKADHSPTSSAKVKNSWRCSSTPK